MKVRLGFAALALAATAACLISSAARAETVGNPLLPRPITDTAIGSIFVVEDPFTQPGNMTDWGVYRRIAPGGQVTPVIFRQAPNGWEITGIGATRTSTNAGAQSYAFDLVSGTADVGPGYYFGWKDGGQGSDNAGIIEWTDGGPPTVDWLSAPHTTFAVGEVRPTALSLGRTYSIQADTKTSGLSVETIGNPIVDAPIVDGAVGSLFVMTSSPFTESASVTDWRFFAGGALDITPLIVEKMPDASYVIRGIGATRSIDGSGEQRFDFDLVSGSDAVGPNHFLAWKDGGQGTNNLGVPEWDNDTPDHVTWFGSPNFGLGDWTTVSVGQSLGTGVLYLPRTYSIDANSTQIPEPTSLALAAMAAVGALVWRRRMA